MFCCFRQKARPNDYVLTTVSPVLRQDDIQSYIPSSSTRAATLPNNANRPLPSPGQQRIFSLTRRLRSDIEYSSPYELPEPIYNDVSSTSTSNLPPPVYPQIVTITSGYASIDESRINSSNTPLQSNQQNGNQASSSRRRQVISEYSAGYATVDELPARSQLTTTHNSSGERRSPQLPPRNPVNFIESRTDVTPVSSPVYADVTNERHNGDVQDRLYDSSTSSNDAPYRRIDRTYSAIPEYAVPHRPVINPGPFVFRRDRPFSFHGEVDAAAYEIFKRDIDTSERGVGFGRDMTTDVVYEVNDDADEDYEVAPGDEAPPLRSKVPSRPPPDLRFFNSTQRLERSTYDNVVEVSPERAKEAFLRHLPVDEDELEVYDEIETQRDQSSGESAPNRAASINIPTSAKTSEIVSDRRSATISDAVSAAAASGATHRSNDRPTMSDVIARDMLIQKQMRSSMIAARDYDEDYDVIGGPYEHIPPDDVDQIRPTVEQRASRQSFEERMASEHLPYVDDDSGGSSAHYARIADKYAILPPPLLGKTDRAQIALSPTNYSGTYATVRDPFDPEAAPPAPPKNRRVYLQTGYASIDDLKLEALDEAAPPAAPSSRLSAGHVTVTPGYATLDDFSTVDSAGVVRRVDSVRRGSDNEPPDSDVIPSTRLTYSASYATLDEMVTDADRRERQSRIQVASETAANISMTVKTPPQTSATASEAPIYAELPPRASHQPELVHGPSESVQRTDSIASGRPLHWLKKDPTNAQRDSDQRETVHLNGATRFEDVTLISRTNSTDESRSKSVVADRVATMLRATSHSDLTSQDRRRHSLLNARTIVTTL